MNAPLDGLRIIEVATTLAPQWAAMHLADLGAEVIKVEPPGGAPERRSELTPGIEDRTFTWLNRGKRGIVVDPATPEGREVLGRLAATADAIVTDAQPAAAQEMGIDYARLSTLRPPIVYCRISGYGPEGELAYQEISDVEAQAFAGTAAVIAKSDGHGAPEVSSVPLSELLAGQIAAFSTIAALVHAGRTGEGQEVDVSLAGAAMAIIGQMIAVDPVNDEPINRPLVARIEQARADGGAYAEMLAIRNAAPIGRGGHGMWYGGYGAKDGGISVGCLTPATRRAMRRVLGIEGDDIDDPDFNAADPANVASLAALQVRIREIMASRTVAEWLEVFQQNGVPAAPVQFPELLANDPQAALMMVDLVHPLNGRQRQAGPFFTMTASPPEVQGPSPLLGQHTDEVLRQAGYSIEDVRRLRGAGSVA